MRQADEAPRFRRATGLLRDALTLAALIFIAWAWLFAVRFVIDDGISRAAIDAHAYWSVDLAHLYRGAVGDLDFFPYTPAIAQFLMPLSILPWPVFYGVWLAIILGSLVYLVGPIPAALLLAVPLVWADVTTGNIHLLLTVAIVLGFRYPGTWAFVLLGKVTPGIGLLWFVVRREWRELGIALAITGAVMLVSVILAPGLWSAWIGIVRSNAGAPPRLLGLTLAVRFPVAAAVVVAGALTGKRWTLPIAGMLALPILWENSLTMLAGIVPLLGWRWLDGLRRWPWFGQPPESAKWSASRSARSIE
jgi:hypothetical protein